MGAVDSEFECTRHIMQQRHENNVYIVMLYFNVGFAAASSLLSLLLLVYVFYENQSKTLHVRQLYRFAIFTLLNTNKSIFVGCYLHKFYFIFYF